MAILSDSEIVNRISDGRIIIEGYDEKYSNPNSYDLTIGSQCKIYHPYAFGSKVIKELFSKERLDEYLDWADNITSNDDWFLDCKVDNPTFEFTIPEKGFILQPNHLYLFACNEKVGLMKDTCASVMGKSSLGRLGLDIHICAGFMDTGFHGSLVLELRTIYPLKIYPNMKICQIKFEDVIGEPMESYDKKTGSKYMNQEGVVSSRMDQNWKEKYTLNDLLVKPMD